MSFDLILSSKLAKLQRNGDQNVPHDFPINFPTPIYLDSEKYQAALKNISMSYSWYNIDAAYDNNKIRWRKKTEQAWKTLTFPNGMYDSQGGYSEFQVTGMIEWGQKSIPKKNPRASNKTQKNPWTKN